MHPLGVSAVGQRRDWQATVFKIALKSPLKNLGVSNEVTNHSVGLRLDMDCGLKKHNGTVR